MQTIPGAPASGIAFCRLYIPPRQPAHSRFVARVSGLLRCFDFQALQDEVLRNGGKGVQMAGGIFAVKNFSDKFKASL